MAKKKKLTKKQYGVALLKVAQITYRAAPGAIIVKLIGAFITAVLPIVTTFFAALTTTALAGAYAGDATAGSNAIFYVVITAGLGILMAVWNSIDSYLQESMRYRVEAAMTDQMYEHFLSLDFWRYDDKTTIDLYDRAADFARFFPYVFDRLTAIVTQLITVVAGIVAMVLVSWWLGLLLLIAIIPGVYLQYKLSRAQIEHREAHFDTRRTKNVVEWSLLQPKKIAELRLYGLVRHLLDLRQTLRDKDEKVRIEFEKKFILRKIFADIIEAAAEVIALIWVVLQIIAHAQPVGQFIYVQQIIARSLSGVRSLVQTLNSIDEDLANLFDYQIFMELPRSDVAAKTLVNVPDVISLRDITFHYPQSDANVLKGVSFDIKRGQHIAIVGENGAGKSTLIKIITGLYRPVNGEIFVDGVGLNDVSVSSWHKYLAVLQQEYIEYSFATAKENVTMGDVSRPVNDLRLNTALDKAEAGSFVKKLPKGLDSYVNNWMEYKDGSKGSELSGGQWQRLALARNFYRNSPIIILDEPTSAIDALAESRIFDHLFAEKGRTVITVSHRLTTIEKADVIYMLQEGKVVEAGTHKELVKKRGAYYRMFKSQLKASE